MSIVELQKTSPRATGLHLPDAGRILVIGSANVDLITRIPHLPARGETVTGGTFQQAMGGKGANQAVAARRAGAAVSLVTSVGTDAYGTGVLDSMRTERIDTSGTRTDPDQPTGVALILVDDAGNNSIAVASGANFSLLPEHLADVFEDLSTFDMLLLQNELAPQTLLAILATAARASTHVLLNYAPAGDLTIDQLSGVQTTLVVNEAEAAKLTGLPTTTSAEATSAVIRLHDQGFQAAIVTLGDRGSVCAHAGGTLITGAMPVKAVDTTAAGDTFCGAFAAAIVRNVALPQALRFAAAAAALATTRHGAQPSIPTHWQIASALNEWPEP